MKYVGLSALVLALAVFLWIANSRAGCSSIGADARIGSGANGSGFWARATVFAGDGQSGYYDIHAWDNIESDRDVDAYEFGTWQHVFVNNNVSGTNATAYIVNHNFSCSDYAEAS